VPKNRYIPFGYGIQNGEITIIDDEAEVVKDIFNRYLKGMSYNQISKIITIPYMTESPLWNKHRIKRILENPKYTGANGYIVIVPRETFEKVQEVKRQKNPPQIKSIIISDVPIRKTPPLFTYEPNDDVNEFVKILNDNFRQPEIDSVEIKNLIYKYAAAKYDCCRLQEGVDESL